MTEKLDIFDEHFAPAGEPATFDVTHKRGLWHQTFACWLVSRERGTVVFQLRGPKNIIDPGSLDASAGGHLIAGEKPEEGFRELSEELGIDIPANDRIPLGYFRNTADRGPYINREFCHVYLAPCEKRLDEMKLEKGEVDGVFETGVEDALRLFSGAAAGIRVKGIAWNGIGYAAVEKDAAVADMCNHAARAGASGYYMTVMKAADALLRGAKIEKLKP